MLQILAPNLMLMSKKIDGRSYYNFIFGETSQDPHELPAVLKYPPELHFLSISPPELSIAFNLDPSVQIRAQKFSKRPKYP
jgi:hypothetical protein